MIYIIIILLECIILCGVVCLVLKYLSKSKKSLSSDKIHVSVSNDNITSEMIRDGIKSAFREIDYEKSQEKIFKDKMKFSEGVYSTIQKDIPVKNSGGNLVPYNITDEEKSVLEMFYGKD